MVFAKVFKYLKQKISNFLESFKKFKKFKRFPKFQKVDLIEFFLLFSPLFKFYLVYSTNDFSI